MSRKLSPETLSRHFSRSRRDAESNYDIMVDNVRALGHASVDCRTCSGKGYRELPADELRNWSNRIAKQKTAEHRDQARQALRRASDCPTCKGTGKVSARRGDHSAAMDSMFTTVRCGRCRGGGEVTTPTDTSAERQDVCLECGGATYIVPVTVRCRASSGSGNHGGSSATDGDAVPLMLPASTSEPVSEPDESVTGELEQLHAADPQLAAALASYHGHESEPWVEHRWGRAFVLWQHTPAGKLLAENVAERSPARAGYLITPTERLAQAREAVERPIAGRPPAHHQLDRVLVARADREARELQRRVLALTTTREHAA